MQRLVGFDEYLSLLLIALFHSVYKGGNDKITLDTSWISVLWAQSSFRSWKIIYDFEDQRFVDTLIIEWRWKLGTLLICTLLLFSSVRLNEVFLRPSFLFLTLTFFCLIWHFTASALKKKQQLSVPDIFITCMEGFVRFCQKRWNSVGWVNYRLYEMRWQWDGGEK